MRTFDEDADYFAFEHLGMLVEHPKGLRYPAVIAHGRSDDDLYGSFDGPLGSDSRVLSFTISGGFTRW